MRPPTPDYPIEAEPDSEVAEICKPTHLLTHGFSVNDSLYAFWAEVHSAICRTIALQCADDSATARVGNWR